MAKFRVVSVEERVDSDIACDTFVIVEKPDGEGGTVDIVIGHFTVILHAAEVLASAQLPKAQRIALYKTLFAADPRIMGVTDSEAAVAQMGADVAFPVTVSL